MIAALLLLLKPFLPYIVGAVSILLGGGTFLWSQKRKSKAEGVAEQKAKEADARAQELDRIKSAADARPAGGVQSDPNNRDNTKRQNP